MAKRLRHMVIAESTRGHPGYLTTVGYQGWTGKVEFCEAVLDKPRHWHKPRTIFVCSMSDLFQDAVPFEWVDKVLAVIGQCKQHTSLMLTKRPNRMLEYFCGLRDDTKQAWRLSSSGRSMDHRHGIAMRYRREGYLPNLHLGVTVEDQEAVGRIETLRQIPASKRWVSFEPLLQKIKLEELICEGVDYAYIGCESGARARVDEHTNDNIRELAEDLTDAGVRVGIKQIVVEGRPNKHAEQWPDWAKRYRIEGADK